MELRRAARHAIKLLDRQLQRAVFIGMIAQQRSEPADRKNRLHSAFAEGVLVTDDDRAAVVLKRSCENLARRRTLPAGKNNQWTGISDARIWIRRNPDRPAIIFCLNYRT